MAPSTSSALPRLALVLALAVPGVGLAGAGRAAGQEVEAFRAKTGKWVETRQLISKEKSGWDADKELLAASRDLLRQQKQALEAEIQELRESNTASDEERRELLLQRGEHQRASRALEERIRAMELGVLALAPRLPEPLKRRLDLLLVQIPDDPETAGLPLGQRLMNVLGVLAQAEKFNGTATFVGETRAFDGAEQKVQVRTLYWGLGQAVYVDATGESAGIGRPGSGGWVFTEDPDLADDAGRLLDIYEGNVDAIEFVEFPVEIE